MPSAPGRPRWTPLAIVYLVLAAVGLVGTWTLNILLLPLAAITAAAFVIPLFLALRERRLAAEKP